MSRSTALKELKDYVRSLKMHKSDRRAVHLKISILERHLRQPTYRRAAAVHIKPLIDKYSAKNFILDNGDMMILTHGATIDNIDTVLWNIRDEYGESTVLQGMHFEPGQDNAFVNWFDLNSDYDALMAAINGLDAAFSAPSLSTGLGGTAQAGVSASKGPDATATVAGRAGKKIKILPIDVPKKDTVVRDMDPEMLVSLTKALHGADVGGLIRKQTVAVRTPDGKEAPVMVHRGVPLTVALDSLLKGTELVPDIWLMGYLEDYLANRMLASVPNVKNSGSMASSLAVTSSAINSELLDIFAQSLGEHPRGGIIFQFNIRDAICQPRAYQAAVQRVRDMGFRTAIAGLEVAVLNWLSKADLTADFLKIEFPDEPMANWLDASVETSIKQAVSHHGVARFILDRTETEDQIKLAQRLGISLFQGAAISEVSV